MQRYRGFGAISSDVLRTQMRASARAPDASTSAQSDAGSVMTEGNSCGASGKVGLAPAAATVRSLTTGVPSSWYRARIPSILSVCAGASASVSALARRRDADGPLFLGSATNLRLSHFADPPSTRTGQLEQPRN